jgi:hypothetical protein
VGGGQRGAIKRHNRKGATQMMTVGRLAVLLSCAGALAAYSANVNKSGQQSNMSNYDVPSIEKQEKARQDIYKAACKKESEYHYWNGHACINDYCSKASTHIVVGMNIGIAAAGYFVLKMQEHERALGERDKDHDTKVKTFNDAKAEQISLGEEYLTHKECSLSDRASVKESVDNSRKWNME